MGFKLANSLEGAEHHACNKSHYGGKSYGQYGEHRRHKRYLKKPNERSGMTANHSVTVQCTIKKHPKMLD